MHSGLRNISRQVNGSAAGKEGIGKPRIGKGKDKERERAWERGSCCGGVRIFARRRRALRRLGSV